jgi:hypothetical protein
MTHLFTRLGEMAGLLLILPEIGVQALLHRQLYQWLTGNLKDLERRCGVESLLALWMLSAHFATRHTR